MKRLFIYTFTILIAVVLTHAGGQTPAVKEKKNETTTADRIVDGYHNVKWGSPLPGVKNEVRGKIVYTDEKKTIQTRDGDIEYLYGFFYKEIPVASAKTEKSDTPTQQEGRLFYVAVQFPYLAMEDVRAKLHEKYGAPTGESLKNNQGALVWESNKTTIIMWVDRYEKKPYCRKITYVGREIAKELVDYRKEIFNSAEIEILKKMNP